MADTTAGAPESADKTYRDTVFLPKTDFPMKAGLAAAEPKWLERWEKEGFYARLREGAKGRPKFILHDGPPYANGHLHIGTALNKILKDFVVRSQGMLGKDAPYVPGWDCHGLPIEWAVEQEYRKAAKSKEDIGTVALRKECRAFAEKWIDIQREEFKRLGCIGEWERPYTTMAYSAEAVIVGELHKFLMSGALYRGSKPVMWSIVEKTALAEAEIEYHEVASTTIYVKFPLASTNPPSLWEGARGRDGNEAQPTLQIPHPNPPPEGEGNDLSILIWTTTPWTIPGNRAIAYSRAINYGVYEIVGIDEGSFARPGERLALADDLAETVRTHAKIASWRRVADFAPQGKRARHPFNAAGYDFTVPLLAGDHVMADTGTGFVHTAPGHGQEDYELWMEKQNKVFHPATGPAVPETVDENGVYTELTGFLAGKRVLTPDGKEGDANGAVIRELVARGALLAKGKLRHQYPHSWRSKAPIIFRNTPQWFVALDKPFAHLNNRTLREVCLSEIDRVQWVPPAGRNRIRAMVENRPDWVLSRQRAWGVPIAIFADKKTGEPLRDEAVNKRIQDAFAAEGADAWFASPPERFLGNKYQPTDYEQVTDILDVWFDSGSTHVFTLEQGPWGLKWPADCYLEGSDQHRGWFQSSLLESCGTRGRAPYEAVITHGFVLDEKGEEKMSKSKGNVLSPIDISKSQGAEILRLWVASCDYMNDVRFGPTILAANGDTYRKLRNTLRFLLGALADFSDEESLSYPEIVKAPVKGLDLELFMLHRLAELDGLVRESYAAYDFNRVYSELFNFCTNDLSAFYLDIRKDVLYCDPPSSMRRRACRTVLDHVFSALTAWLAPILCFTMEEVWLTRFPAAESVHLREFPHIPQAWRDEALAKLWQARRRFRRVVTGALEIERKNKVIGSSLEAAPRVFVEDGEIRAAIAAMRLPEFAITSGLELAPAREAAPETAFRLDDVPGVAVEFRPAPGEKCGRCWMILEEVGSVAAHPKLCRRCADAVGQMEAA
jgi:isoleucyl-tRNA synthetase